MLHPATILDADQARAADRITIDDGTPGSTLMENAGRAVADVICEQYKPAPTLIVCGIGNNGGDGFVVARWLKQRDWPVTLAVVGNDKQIFGDADTAKHKWETSGGKTLLFDEKLLDNKALVVDALFGTGLDREVEGKAKSAIETINKHSLPVISVDIASGIDASTGGVRGVAIRATQTVTFLRPKLGHVLLPGKAHTGQLHVYDIGISGENVTPTQFLNLPILWQHSFPALSADIHKYTRGHAIIMGASPATTGASRLAALGALRAGAGLVSVACSQEALPVYAAALTAVMTKVITNAKELDNLLADERVTSMCIGPGSGVNEKTREHVLQLLKHKKPAVLDADALTSFKDGTKPLFSAVMPHTVLTPHEGEFERLFTAKGAKHLRAQTAAKEAGCVIVLKGNDTIIAAPDGRVAINAEAPVWLATAGSGDVLTGIITGLLAQKMPAFEAACAGVWLHSKAASLFGPGLIADDLPLAMAGALKILYGDQ